MSDEPRKVSFAQPPPPPQQPPTHLRDPRLLPWRGIDILLAFVTGTVVGIVFAVLLLIAAGIGRLEFREPGVYLAIFSVGLYAGEALAMWFFAVRRYNLSFKALGFRAVHPWVLAAMVPLTIVVLIFNAIVVYIVSLFSPQVTRAQAGLFPGKGEFELNEFLVLFALIAVLAPIAEELLFRGVLYQYLRTRRSVRFAVLVSAGLFALAHFIPLLLPSLFALGIVLALLVERYKSIYPAIALHALNNGVAVVLAYAASR